MSELSRSRVDLDAPLARPQYVPRAGKFLIPASGSLDEPLICFKVNSQWVGHIIGVFDALDQPDAWNGTPNAIENARAEVRKIIASMEICNEVITDIRINNCIIEVYVGGEWIAKADITACVDSIAGGSADDEFRDRPWDEPTEADKAPDTSELDCVWGGVKSVVDYVFTVFNNALDVMEAAADAADAAGDFITGTPGFSYLPPAQAFEGFSVGFGITVAVCRLADTPEVRDILACDLFCKIRAGGDPYNLSDAIIENWVDAINSLSLEFPPQTYSPGLGFLVAVINLMIGRRYLYQRYALGLNNCDNDWEILCTDCPTDEWTAEIDFTVTQGGWTTYGLGPFTPSTGGVWTSGVGWEDTLVQDNSPGSHKFNIVAIQLLLSEDANITSIRAFYNYTRGYFKFASAEIHEIRSPAATQLLAKPYPVDDGSNDMNTSIIDISSDQIRVRVNTSYREKTDNTSPAGSATITSIRITGNGVIPAELAPYEV